jgi:hypothetical protein
VPSVKAPAGGRVPWLELVKEPPRDSTRLVFKRDGTSGYFNQRTARGLRGAIGVAAILTRQAGAYPLGRPDRGPWRF